jgi:hypothetical protein
MYYELHELGQEGKIHELNFENIADIGVCLRIVSEIKKTQGANDKGEFVCNWKRVEEITKGIPNIDCLPETIQKMSKVTIPIGTDY